MAQPTSYLRPATNGFIVELYIAPRAKLSKVTGLHGGYPKLALAAPPIEGRANEELVRFLSSLLAIPKGSIELLRGATSKRKSLLIQGVPAEIIRQRLETKGCGD